MYYRPTKVDFEGLKFLIMSAPVDSIMKQTIKVSEYMLNNNLGS